MARSDGASADRFSRRALLARIIHVLGGLMTAVIGLPSLAYVLSPGWRRGTREWVDLAGAGEVPKGRPVKIDYVHRSRDGWTIRERQNSAWVYTPDGREFTVFSPACTHLGCAYRWDGAKKKFLCPCHTAVFGIDGRVISGPPPRPLDRYQAKVVGGRLLILPGEPEAHA